MAEYFVLKKVNPKRVFVEAFSIVARKFLVLRGRLAKKDVRYDECPDICGQTEKTAKSFCEGCPIKKEDIRFEKETKNELSERLGDSWKDYSFDGLQTAVVNALILESDGEEDGWFTGTEILISVLRREKSKIEKAEHQNMMSGLKTAKEVSE